LAILISLLRKRRVLEMFMDLQLPLSAPPPLFLKTLLQLLVNLTVTVDLAVKKNPRVK
jgi:hypothetical protein